MRQRSSWVAVFLVSITWQAGCHLGARGGTQVEAVANDNRHPAGRMQGDTIQLALEVRPAGWRPEEAEGEVLPVQAFAEAGKPPEIPGPLLRIPAGTIVRARVHNRLSDSTLTLHGFYSRPAADTTPIRIGPGETREIQFTAGAPGTYYYWGSTTGTGLDARQWLDSQLHGALIIDSAGTRPDDRVFVLGIWSHLSDKVGAGEPDTGEVMVINGRAWPHTEHLQLPVGDSVHWRWINPTTSSHPMHLHGTYFALESRGDAARDTVFPAGGRPLEVTELMFPGGTATIRWAPARPGNWLMHCHFAFHVSPAVSLDRRLPPHGHHRMAGLVLGITATGMEPAPDPARFRPLRLLVQEQPHRIRGGPGYGYVLQRGPPPTADSVDIPGPPLVLTQGEPVAITVVNRLSEPSAVHWHGMELTSYNDGVPDLSGMSPRLFRAIAPGDSFTARFTPPRSGTFIYHTHLDEDEQMTRGLYGALLVLAPGRRYDPAADQLVIVGGNGPVTAPDSVPGLVNGSRVPLPVVLAPGKPNRLRLINIDPNHRIVFTLLQDTTVARWRALAKDGADLPPSLATERRAVLMTGPGETADFEVTPRHGEALTLRITAPFADVPWTITLPLKVR